MSARVMAGRVLHLRYVCLTCIVLSCLAGRVSALYKLPPAGDVDGPLAKLKLEDPQKKCKALRTLARFMRVNELQRVMEPVLKALRHPEPEVREEAARVLSASFWDGVFVEDKLQTKLKKKRVDSLLTALGQMPRPCYVKLTRRRRFPIL